MSKQHESAKASADNLGGRPPIEINWNTVEKLCAIQCTGEEIAGVLGVDYDTLLARIKEKYKCGFSDYFKRHSASGRMSLRRKQIEGAMNGNTALLIFLGKQYLGQSDKQATELTGKDGTDLEIKIIREFVD